MARSPLAGFVAKEKAYAALVHGGATDRPILAVLVVGSMLTVAYSARFAAALWRPDLLVVPSEPRTTLDAGPRHGILAPALVLASATALLGLWPATWSRLVDGAANSLDPAAHAHLELWHGFNAALVLSAITLAGGALIFALRRPVSALQARLAPRRSGVDAYDASVRGVLRGAGWVTSVVQSGSLPVYAGIILATAALAPLLAMVSGAWWPGWPDAIGRAGQIPAAGMLVAGATAATVATRRFAAALLLGVVGYGMALLFVVQGAPDLALTQFAVETLSVVVFLLVLRRLPDRFERESQPLLGRAARLAVSALVGVWVAVGAIAFSGARTAAPVSEEMVARSLPEGYGENVVNVILVDIRGLDTMGEITVLVAAGIGIAALARAGRPPRPRPERRSIREHREEVGA
ncbi:MAG: hydrogen gas-evolving membrane-bound hydrogenase subunit E [Acidimicrobiales bacterium]